MATEMPTDQTQVYPLALRQYLHQMVLKYHFCWKFPHLWKNILPEYVARARNGLLQLGKWWTLNPWTFGHQSIIFLDLPEKFCSPRCPRHFPGCSYFVGVASESLDRNLSISHIHRAAAGQGLDVLPPALAARKVAQADRTRARLSGKAWALWKITMWWPTSTCPMAKRNSSGTHII